MYKSNKKGKVDMLTLVLGGILVFVLFGGSFGTVNQSAAGGSSAGDSAVPAGNVVQVVGAPCTQATTLTASVIRRYTEVAQTAQNVTILQNGNLRATVSHGSTTSVQSGTNADTLDLYSALQATTFYARHLQGKISTCTASATTGDAVFKEVDDATVGGAKVSYTDASGLFASAPNKVVQMDTAPTITVTNPTQSDSQTATNEVTGENLTIGTGGVGSVEITIKPTINTGWGVNGNILACQYPSSMYDSTNGVQPSVGGSALEVSSVSPSNINFVLIQANNTVKSWKFQGLDGRKTSSLKVDVTLQADTNHDPASILDRVNCTVFDTNFYQKQQTGAYVLDIENRDTNADLGGANNIYDFVIGVE